MRIFYQKNNTYLKNKAEKIVAEIKKRFENVKIQPKPNTYGVGGTITIHRKEDIKRIASYDLFYPNLNHYKKFYKYWKDN